LAGAAAMLLLVLPARADFRVDTGDVIEIVVTSAPELQRRLPVRIDGNISFPLIGTMKVAGLTASELQDRVQAALSAKVFQ
ncbi:polysaccharide biosynthesis/export family protein, partial [Klebsiella pneumoniae]|nr:polysaccharide biosynthesis/export family protein [Klebsiella pneumoniae]